MKLQLDWSAYENAGMGDAYADIPKTGGDYAKAIAVCIGSQQCQRPNKGVMCPSYRVTENSLLSPGGRVKLLKTALNQTDNSALFSPQVREAMSLCVSCKGCKRECENEVDMALIKAEYQAQYYQQQPLPLRNRLFANLPILLRLPLSRTLIHWRNRLPWLAQLSEKLLGVSANIDIPLPAAKAFKTPTSAIELGAERCVVLFADTFSRHFSPQALQAADQLLKSAGYRVEWLNSDANTEPLCCGRSYFSNGQLQQARQHAEKLLHALLPYAKAGHSIIGLEPACILSMRDEYLKMGFGETAKQVAERVLLLEEFIAREQTSGHWQLDFKVDTTKLLVHGHCWQKASGAMKSMRKVLKSVRGLDFEFIESSCCGMAGHFGLEAEHYAIAQQMAEAALYPALRAQPDTAILANGFSCQQQIRHGGFLPPRHLAEFLNTACAPKQNITP